MFVLFSLAKTISETLIGLIKYPTETARQEREMAKDLIFASIGKKKSVKWLISEQWCHDQYERVWPLIVDTMEKVIATYEDQLHLKLDVGAFYSEIAEKQNKDTKFIKKTGSRTSNRKK